jgi:hypothetical protein
VEAGSRYSFRYTFQRASHGLRSCQKLLGRFSALPAHIAAKATIDHGTIGPIARSLLMHLPSRLNCSLHSYAFFTVPLLSTVFVGVVEMWKTT